MKSGHAITDDSTSIIDQVKLRFVETAKSFIIDMWLARITPDKVMPILHKVIDAAKDQYADSIKHGGGIYAVGYCVGGRFVLLLAKKTEGPSGDKDSGIVNSGPYIKAGAIAHAASVVPDDFRDIKAPLSFACVENDPLFPDEVRSAGEDIMSDGNLEHEVQVYPRVPHGESNATDKLLVRCSHTDRFRVRCRGRVSGSSNQGCPDNSIRANAQVDAGPLKFELPAFVLMSQDSWY